MNIDCEEIFLRGIILSSEELNLFLRSWQEGKTNRNLKRCEVQLEHHYDYKEVLEGCGGKLMDPRTTKKRDYYSFENGRSVFVWIHGGIHIKRNDGQIALIDKFTYETMEENTEIEQHAMDYYLNEIKKWNPDDDDVTNLANTFKDRGFFLSARYDLFLKIVIF